ncbi:MAG: glycosyltransferase, partial [bacterium]
MNLAIISPNKNAYSETFIKAHVEKISFNNYLYNGGWLPEYCNSKNVLSSIFFVRVYRYLNRKLFKKTFREIITKALIKSFKKNNINAILAEYGPTGVAIYPIAQKLNIPLFVFFHGQDASKKSRMEENKQGYIQLSNKATGIFLASQTLADNLIKLGCSSEKFVINPCPPDTKCFKNQPEFQDQNILATGR